MIYADYFMISRLAHICSNYIKKFVTVANVLSILLIAHAHNSNELETFCINFICLNEVKILDSKEWRKFKEHTSHRESSATFSWSPGSEQRQSQSMFEYFIGRFVAFKSDNFVQHSIE